MDTRNVISLALFGKDSRYYVYVGAVLRGYRTLFPGFEIWLHHDRFLDESKAGEALRKLAKMGIVRLVNMGTAPLTAAMLWRIRPIWEDGVGAVFSRDIDSLPTPRERHCVDRFLASDMTLHTIHDSSAHSGIMGGLNGIRSAPFKKITGLCSLNDLYAIAGYSDDRWGRHGSDQDALNAFVVPWLQGKVFEHMWDGWNGGHPNLPPVPRRQPTFLGMNEYVPDEVKFDGWDDATVQTAGKLISHMGGAGFDVAAASSFFDATGPREEMAVIKQIEEEFGGWM